MLSGDTGPPTLTVEALSITFEGLPAHFSLVDAVSLTINPGRTLCIVGESGCGKSLLSLAVMGLLPRPAARVQSGRVRLDGTDLLNVQPDALSDLRGDRMAMIFQEPMTSLNPVFTVGDQLIEAVRRHQDVSGPEARALALEMLKRVRIPSPESRLNSYPHQMSGGMRQRVMIAMALVNGPKLLIADEPTTALDVTIQAQILRLIRELQAEIGMAVLFVTHDLGVVAEVADEVAVMYAGRIVERGPVADVFASPQHPYTIGLMGALPSTGGRTGRLTSIPGAVPPPQMWPAGCRFSNRCPVADARCKVEVPVLTEMGSGHQVACFKAPLEAQTGTAA